MINLDKPSLLVKGSLEDIKRYLHTLVDSLQYALEDNEGMISECREKLANYEDGNANIAELELAVSKNSAAIKSQAVTVGANSTNIANLKIESDTQGANISLLVGNDGVKGGVIVNAINGQSSAKIRADKLDIEGKVLNIKVQSTNIEGKIKADQIEADGISAKDVDLTGTINAEGGEIGGWDIGDNLTATTTTTGGGVIQTQTVTFSPSGVKVVASWNEDFNSGLTPIYPSGVTLGQQYSKFVPWYELLKVYE